MCIRMWSYLFDWTENKPDEEFVSEILKLLGLTEKVKNRPNQLSEDSSRELPLQGLWLQNLRLFLLMNRREIWDSRTSAEVMGLLQMTSREFNQTIIMITHNEEIAQLADRIIHLEDGKVVGGDDHVSKF